MRLLLLALPCVCWAGGTGKNGPEDEGFGPSSWLSRLKEGADDLENGGYTSVTHVASEQRLRSHNQVHNSAATAAKTGNKVTITSASTGVVSSVAVDASSGTNAKRLLGATTTLPGTAATAALGSGNSIVISSVSADITSKVSIDSSSGAQAKALLGSGTAQDGAAAQGSVAATSGTFTGTFSAQDFSGAAQTLKVVVDGRTHSIQLSSKLDTKEKAVAAIHVGLKATKTSAVCTSSDITPVNFVSAAEELIIVVDGVPRSLTLKTNLANVQAVVDVLALALSVHHRFRGRHHPVRRETQLTDQAATAANPDYHSRQGKAGHERDIAMPGSFTTLDSAYPHLDLSVANQPQWGTNSAAGLSAAERTNFDRKLAASADGGE